MGNRKWIFTVYIKALGYPEPFPVWQASGHHGGLRNYKWERFIQLADAFNGWMSGILEDLVSMKRKEDRVDEIGRFNPYFRRGDKKPEWIPMDRIKEVYYTIDHVNVLGFKKRYATIGGELDEESLQHIRQRRNEIMFGGGKEE